MPFDFFRQQWAYPYSGRTWNDLARLANAAMLNVAIDYLWPLLQIPSNGFAIDLGCGNGWLAYWLSSFRQVIAIDTNESALRTICRSYGKGIHAVVGDGMCVPVASESVDIIFMCATYHHMSDRRAALTEWHRILKHGGRLAAMGEIWSSEEDIERRTAEFAIQGVVGEYGYTKPELMELLENKAFSAMEYVPIKYFDDMQNMGRAELATAPNQEFDTGLILATK